VEVRISREALPRNAGGKLMKDRLRQIFGT
jgi:acyl-coenzyme A synthetase/AMP-(fatty) acid ligase